MGTSARTHRRDPLILDAEPVRGSNGYKTVYGVRGLGDTGPATAPADAALEAQQAGSAYTLPGWLVVGGLAAALAYLWKNEG